MGGLDVEAVVIDAAAQVVVALAVPVLVVMGVSLIVAVVSVVTSWLMRALSVVSRGRA